VGRSGGEASLNKDDFEEIPCEAYGKGPCAGATLAAENSQFKMSFRAAFCWAHVTERRLMSTPKQRSKTLLPQILKRPAPQ